MRKTWHTNIFGYPIPPKISKEDREIPFKVGIPRGKKIEEKIPVIKLHDWITKQRVSSRNLGRKFARSTGRSRTLAFGQKYLQRVVVKSRVVRTRGFGAAGIIKHVEYLQRDGVGLDGAEPQAFNTIGDLPQNEMRDIAYEWAEDRHHFRLIISPEKGRDLDLRLYAKELVERMEKDLSTKLEWVAVTHHNTERPHVHLMIRGRDDLGADLVISKDYLAYGLRARAQEIATKGLGFRTELDIAQDIERSITELRPTGIDSVLVKESKRNQGGLIDLRNAASEPQISFERNKVRRLRYLEGVGLAEEVNIGLWRIDENLTGELRDKATEKDIIKTMHLRMRGIDPDAELIILDEKKLAERSVSGKVIKKGLSDELFDTKYVVIEGENHRAYYVRLSKNSEVLGQECTIGDTIKLGLKERDIVTKSDENILRFAETNGGVYETEGHIPYVRSNLKLPFGVSAEQYVQQHQRRVRSLSGMGLIKEMAPGRWEIPDDLIASLAKRRLRFIAIDILERHRDRGISLGI